MWHDSSTTVQKDRCIPLKQEVFADEQSMDTGDCKGRGFVLDDRLFGQEANRGKRSFAPGALQFQGKNQAVLAKKHVCLSGGASDPESAIEKDWGTSGHTRRGRNWSAAHSQKEIALSCKRQGDDRRLVWL